jgi:hypothetical protein
VLWQTVGEGFSDDSHRRGQLVGRHPWRGLYMKSFMRDRKVILTMIKKYTYKEILQTIGYISTTLIPFVPFTVLAFVAKRKLIYANR